MCGIVGVSLRADVAAPREIIESMLCKIKHRGPDGSGIFISGSVGLGHARLSILDLDSGKQPMTSSKAPITIVFNGEIFNYIELREQLLAAGGDFTTSSDTEVILEGYRIFGRPWFGQLNGQYAFAILDERDQSLHLARDQRGEKPLYILKADGVIAFASEVKALIEFANAYGLDKKINLEAVYDFFSLNYVPFGKTFIESITAIPPATYVEIRSGSEVRREVITDLVASGHRESLEPLILDATKIRLRSDVPVGIFLSGGLDSSLLAWSAVKNGARPKAFIADFEERGFSEVTQAMRTCAELELTSELVPIRVTESSIGSLIKKLVYHGDVPLADSSGLAVYLLSEATSKSVKVVLSGDGGDELFGGYLTYTATALARAIPRPIRATLSAAKQLPSLFTGINNKVGFFEKLERFLRGLSYSPGAAHFAWNGMFSAAEKARFLSTAVLNSIVAAEARPTSDTFDLLAQKLAVNPDYPSLSSLIKADLSEYLCNDILVKVDRMTMAHGLEARPVLLDPRIVKFASGLQDRELIKGWTGKHPIRKLIEARLPWYPLNSKKQGFSIPIHLWFRTKFKELMGDIITAKSTRESQIFNPRELQIMWQDHLSGRRQLGFELWGILVSLIWFDVFGVQH